jgi:hypothetical protein
MPTPTVTIPEKVEWSDIHAAISQTPGLKRIAAYLQCKVMSEGMMTLTINEEGRESSTYILGRRAEIERVCVQVLGKPCTVKIEGDAVQSMVNDTAINPDVASSEIVKTASELFDGTLLRVRGIEEDKDSNSSESGGN